VYHSTTSVFSSGASSAMNEPSCTITGTTSLGVSL
jgi:hypothetical protein